MQICRDIIDFEAFTVNLKKTHDWESEVQEVLAETVVGDQGLDCEESNNKNADGNIGKWYVMLPRNAEKESTIMKSMSSCTKQLYWAEKYQSDMVNHINPNGGEMDEFMFWPIYPRDETSVEGMMMVSTHLLEQFGLIEEIEKNGVRTGNYNIHPTTKKRLIFMYGDALSVVNWTACYYRIAQQLSTVGRKKYVENILASYERIIIQKGLFHQRMHQADAIFTVYYGAFLQAVQVSIGDKRVTGNPVKGGFQDHDLFLLKVYHSCTRLLQRRFVSFVANDTFKMEDNETSQSYLIRIQERYCEFRTSWETSKHLPSRMVAQFLKVTASYHRCKTGVTNRDFWLMEKESCDWLGIWKLCGKTTYLRLQCEQIEKLYDDQTFLPFEREMMRLNRICVLSKSKKGVAYDFVNELYNLWLKASPPTPWIETAIARSRHCIIGKHCTNLVFNNKERKRGEVFGRTQENSKLMIECLLTTADIFVPTIPLQ